MRAEARGDVTSVCMIKARRFSSHHLKIRLEETKHEQRAKPNTSQKEDKRQQRPTKYRTETSPRKPTKPTSAAAKTLAKQAKLELD